MDLKKYSYRLAKLSDGRLFLEVRIDGGGLVHHKAYKNSRYFQAEIRGVIARYISKPETIDWDKVPKYEQGGLHGISA